MRGPQSPCCEGGGGVAVALGGVGWRQPWAGALHSWKFSSPPHAGLSSPSQGQSGRQVIFVSVLLETFGKLDLCPNPGFRGSLLIKMLLFPHLPPPDEGTTSQVNCYSFGKQPPVFLNPQPRLCLLICRERETYRQMLT